MIRQSVRSDNGDREGKWVGLCIGLILLIAFVLLPYHQAKEPEAALLSHQVAITDLSPDELAMVAELRLAHEEIRNLFQDTALENGTGNWPELNELEEFWIAPFVKDKSWQRKGRHQWTLVADGTYQGLRQSDSGSMSIVLNSHTKAPDIWLAMDDQAKPFETKQKVDEQQLISNGWTQIVFQPVAENTSSSANSTHSH
ncbi:DUF6162 family protein [Photobacterium leiognathi]|uniref:DUF6162 family protein n=1 Tax=Photobacterium leiognathi TaxID=553611 RepID=UPI002980A5EB|nr:hypothetical protein [Photobacterium leiognathi]